jgi:hypothetical protein
MTHKVISFIKVLNDFGCHICARKLKKDHENLDFGVVLW